MEEIIRVDQKVIVWQRLSIQIPEGMSKEEFIDQLHKEDPKCLNIMDHDIDTMFDTEDVIITEFYENWEDLEPIKIWRKLNSIGSTLQG